MSLDDWFAIAVGVLGIALALHLHWQTECRRGR